MRAATSDARPSRLAAACAAMVAVAIMVVASLSFTTVGAQPQPTSTTPPPAPPVVAGVTLVAEFAAGRVSAVDASGRPTVIATGLKNPNGVAALADGSVLIAESGANRVVGIGGRFGPALKEIVKDIEFPYGLTVGLDGTVYVTLLLKGELGRLDLTAGKYTKISDGLKGPGDLTVRSGQLFVTESLGENGAGRDVIMIDKDGTKSVVAKDFDQPIGIAAGAGRTLFVSDLKAGKIVKIDDAGVKSDFVTRLDAPVQLAIEPYTLKDEPTFTLVVSTKTALVKYDQDGKRVGNPTTLDQPTGVAGVPPTETPLVSPSTTIAPVGGSAPSTTATTRLRPSTTRATLPLDTDTSNTTSSNVLTLSLGLIGMMVVAAIVFLIVRKPKGGAAAGFEERPLDTYTVAEAFGPCAAEEVELAEAEGGLKSVVIQREAAEKRAEEARVRAQTARDELEALRASAAAEASASGAPVSSGATAEAAAEDSSEAAAESDVAESDVSDSDVSDSDVSESDVAESDVAESDVAESDVAAATGDETEPVTTARPKTAPRPRAQLRVQDLGLTTDAGRAALAAFARGELDAHALEERWVELGEQHAIDAVRGVGEADSRTDDATHPSEPDAGMVAGATSSAPGSEVADAAEPAGEPAGEPDASVVPPGGALAPGEPAASAEVAGEVNLEARLLERVEIAESDIEHAEREIERLQEREAQAIDRIAAARGALATCQASHEAKEREDEAAAAAVAAKDEEAARDEAAKKDEADAAEAADDRDPAAPRRRKTKPAATSTDDLPAPPPDGEPPRPKTNFAD